MTKDTSAASIRERIAFFAAEFGTPEPALAYEDGAVLLNDDLLDWGLAHGAPLDWLLLGDVRPLLRAHRADFETRQETKAVLRELDDEARAVLLAGLHAHAAGVPMDDAMAAVREVVEARRAEAGAR